MTSTLEHTQHDHPGEYESLASHQARLLQNTNWNVVFYDYAQPPLPDDDPYNQAMADVPRLLDTVMDGPHSLSAIEDAKAHLDTLYHEFDGLGYVRHTPSEHRGRHTTRPPEDIVTFIYQWIRHTQTSSMYMRGTRQAQATQTLPMQRLQTLAGIVNLSPNPLPPQVESGLWAAAQRIIDDYEEGISAENHNRYYDVQLHGTEHLRQYDISAEEFAYLLNSAQHSYPPELMLGLETVDVLETPSFIMAKGKKVHTIGSVNHSERLMNLYMPGVANESVVRRLNNSPRNDVRGVIRDALDHEFAHIAHYNAPVEWLRRWEELNKRRRVSVSPYAEHAHRSHPDRGRAEDFAEIARVYQSEPLRLMHLSLDHFRLMNELLQSYDNESVQAAYTIFNPNIYSTTDNVAAISRQLDIARQRTIRRRVEHASQHDSRLGHVTIQLTDQQPPRQQAA